jgi:hypothetical protein
MWRLGFPRARRASISFESKQNLHDEEVFTWGGNWQVLCFQHVSFGMGLAF